MYLYKLFGILLYRRFVSSPHLFIYLTTYLCQYGHMETYFILWVVMWFHVISSVVQSVPAQPAGALRAGSAVLSVCSCHCVFRAFITYWRCKMLPARLLSCSHLRISRFCKEFGFLPLKNGIRKPPLGAGGLPLFLRVVLSQVKLLSASRMCFTVNYALQVLLMANVQLFWIQTVPFLNASVKSM